MEVSMRKKRQFIEGVAYHVTSRTNDKKQVFACNLGKKIILLVLKEAREKFGFRLANFCIMPTHLHLLIIPGEKGNLSQIMHWIKTHSAKRWNRIHGSTDHLWGERYFARPIKDLWDYFSVIAYIDQNPVKAGLAPSVGEWKASGAYYIRHNLSGLVDYTNLSRLSYVRQLPAP
jgi:REP element-mobilizing transposase RayT